MSQEKSKTYAAEFRASTVKLANESDKPIAQSVRYQGIYENALHTWLSKYCRPLEQNKTVRTDEHLYPELKRLKIAAVQIPELTGNILFSNPDHDHVCW